MHRSSSMMYLACSFYLLSSCGGISKKTVKRGESFVLFTNVDNPEEISLFINGNKNVSNILTWKVENTVIKPYWKDNYTEFRKISMDSNRNILIDNVDESYEGKYLISHSYHNFSAIFEVQLCIQAPLLVFISNGTTSRYVDSNETITCSVSGSGTISVDWIGPEGKKLTNSTKYYIMSYNINTGNSILTILILSRTDSGDYTCRATDGFGSIVQDSIKLTASVPLSVSVDNGNNVTGVSGGSLTIACSVSGTGTINVTWHRTGNILSCGQKYTISSYNYNTGKASLTIQSLSMIDVGNYTCQASDSSGTQQEKFFYVTTAIFTAEVKERTICASIGDNRKVNCCVTGSYQSINWYLGNTPLSDGQKYQISQHTSSDRDLSILTILNVQYNDTSLYTCKAVSSIDGTTVASASVSLSIQDRCPHLEPDCLTSIIIAVIATLIFVVAIISAYWLIRKKCVKAREKRKQQNDDDRHKNQGSKICLRKKEESESDA